MILNFIITTVVIGKQESVGRYQFSSAGAPVKSPNSIFQACLVNTIDLIGRQLQSHFCHLIHIHLLKEAQEPHSLISFHSCLKYGKNSKKCNYNLFHLIVYLFVKFLKYEECKYGKIFFEIA